MGNREIEKPSYCRSSRLDVGENDIAKDIFELLSSGKSWNRKRYQNLGYTTEKRQSILRALGCESANQIKLPERFTRQDDEYLRVPAKALAHALRQLHKPESFARIKDIFIEGTLDLDDAHIEAWLVFDNCLFYGDFKAKHAVLNVLYFRSVEFINFVDNNQKTYICGLQAPGLRIVGGFRFGGMNKPSVAGFIDLRAAEIGGDFILETLCLNPEKLSSEELHIRSADFEGSESQTEYSKQTIPRRIREGSIFFARGANFKRNLTIKNSSIYGEITLEDAQIERSISFEGSLIAHPDDVCVGEMGGNLDKSKAQRARKAYALTADRVKIGGRFSTKPLSVSATKSTGMMFFGKIRLHGAQIKGALFLTRTLFCSKSKSAIAITGATVDGSVSFSHSLILSSESKFSVAARRATVAGDFFLNDEETYGGVDAPWVECQKIDRAGNQFQLGRDEKRCAAVDFLGVDRSEIPGFEDFLALLNFYRDGGTEECIASSWVSLQSPAGHAAIGNKHPSSESENDVSATPKPFNRSWLPNGILLDGSSIKGRLVGKRAVVGFLRPSNGGQGDIYVVAETRKELRMLEAIGAERVLIQGGAMLGAQFVSFGKINFRRATFGANLTFRGAVLRSAGLGQEKLNKINRYEARSSFPPQSYSLSQTVNIGGVSLNGNLDFSNCYVEPTPASSFPATDVGAAEKQQHLPTAIYATRANIEGVVLLNDGFTFGGLISFHAAKISRSFLFEPILWQGSPLDPEVIADYSKKQLQPIRWTLNLESVEVGTTISTKLMASAMFQSEIKALTKVTRQLLEVDSVTSSAPPLRRITDAIIETEVDHSNASCQSYLDDFQSPSRITDTIIEAIENSNPGQQFDFIRRLRADDKGELRKKRIEAEVDLSNATCQSYLDDFQSLRGNFCTPWSLPFGPFACTWPSSIRLNLEGFIYSRFGSPNFDIRLVGMSRVKWLEFQYQDKIPLERWAWIAPWGLLFAFFLLSTFIPILFWILLLTAPFFLAMGKVGMVMSYTWVHNANVARQKLNFARPEALSWTRYKSEPWLQCTSVLRAAGREEAARRVRLSRERLVIFSRKLYPLERIWNAFLLIMFGRGLVRLYPVVWFSAIFSIAAFLFSLAFEIGVMLPSEPVVLIDLEKRRSPIPPVGYETPHGLAYTVDKMSPGLPFRQENRWSPCASVQIFNAQEKLKYRSVCAPRYVKDDFKRVENMLQGNPDDVYWNAKIAEREGLKAHDMVLGNYPFSYRLYEFFTSGDLRNFAWIFTGYGWLLIAGFAISISQILLRED